MTVGEIAGYVASVLVFATFYMKTMMPLRIAGILSNIAFITYASIEGLLPILVLHSALLPLNLVRLSQLRARLREIGAAVVGDFSIKPILPLMKPRKITAGEVLFRAGDPADKLYFLVTGAARFDRLGKSRQSGGGGQCRFAHNRMGGLWIVAGGRAGFQRFGRASGRGHAGANSHRGGEQDPRRRRPVHPWAGAKLTDRELAAGASGHDEKTAQVIVKFLHDDERKICPVGRAASVTFPEVDLFTLVKALFRMN
ncbi:cyclic nucleotide-binding domain-containing protein [Hoeflea sp. CAU 1731]